MFGLEDKEDEEMVNVLTLTGSGITGEAGFWAHLHRIIYIRLDSGHACKGLF